MKRSTALRARVPRGAGHAPSVALVLLLFLPLALGGCGFQLRGGVDIPPDLTPLYIQSGGLVGEAIEARLQGSEVGISPTPADAGMILRVLSENRSSRVVAVDREGKALAFELSFRVRFDAQAGDGRQLLAPQTLTLDRTFDDNPNVAVLGKELESDIIYRDMANDAADQVLLRLRAGLGSG
ncbi:MAG: hypothetical protein K9L70_15820 [Thiohalocapsa sp.]|jgi:LPS-assembly lipoprotein|nr:hypothetical protein [Thiohalocapsa sp.]MCF7991116.1 hypothetical protein [Thiohalocapsa sp.]